MGSFKRVCRPSIQDSQHPSGIGYAHLACFRLALWWWWPLVLTASREVLPRWLEDASEAEELCRPGSV